MPQAHSIESRLQSRIDEFVSDLSEIVREEAMAAVQAALMGEGVASKPGARAGRATKKAGRRKASKAAKAPRRKAKSGRRVRRSSEAIEALGQRVLAHVQANPGQRLEEIGVAMGEDTADLKRPIALLLDAGRLRTTGQKRGTKYFAGRGGAARKTTKKKSAKRAAKKKASKGRKRATAKKAGK